MRGDSAAAPLLSACEGEAGDRGQRRGGQHQAWLHSDEIFAYEHGRNFVPNQEAIMDLGGHCDVDARDPARQRHPWKRFPSPPRIPDLIRRLSKVLRTGPDNWVGLQIGVETGSERLAKMHMPNKTLPLKIGPDGSWQDIVWMGTFQLNRHYWRPAFTVQVGQEGETPEDNWETVALVNRMSRSEVDGRPFEFTITPMQNVPLGHIRSKKWSSMRLDESATRGLLRVLPAPCQDDVEECAQSRRGRERLLEPGH